VDGSASLRPGEAWRFDLTRAAWSRPDRLRYWRPSFTPAAPALERSEAVAQLRPVLANGVALRMLADVPVGIFLSGGIDSSSVVATLAHQGYRLRTFSVVFDERHFDESLHSRRVAFQFGTEHTELFLKPAKVLGEWDQALAAYDQPSIDGVNTYFIAQATRQAGIKVALSGLGGDELFAGYPYFRLLAGLDQTWRRVLAWGLHKMLRWFSPDTMRTHKLGSLLSGGSRLARYLTCRLVMAPSRRCALLRGGAPAGAMALPAEMSADLEAATAGLDVVNAQSFLELSLYLANMLLRDTDQMSMAHALEVREPLLDHVLVETVARLPGPLKLASGPRSRTKALLVDALPTPLPRTILNRPKKGFVFPWEHWLRDELKSKVHATLTNPEAVAAAGIDPGEAGKLWHDFLAHRPGIRYTDVLALLHLITWVQRHGLHMEDAPPPRAGVAAEPLARRLA
jgi:asparagine synthase (glutamine-hydrolysing)